MEDIHLGKYLQICLVILFYSIPLLRIMPETVENLRKAVLCGWLMPGMVLGVGIDVRVGVTYENLRA
jgi:hypothetical protein